MIELVGDELYQWDVGRKVKITPKHGYTISCVHFNDGSDDSLTMVNGVATARIPDELLQQCGSVTVYAVSTKEGGIETTESRQFYIKKKTKPTGYTHVPTEVATINSAITAATQAQASAKEAEGYRAAAQTYATNARDSATSASTSANSANDYKTAAEKAKNEILGNGGTYVNPKDDSALKEIRSAKTEIVGKTGTAKSPNDNSALKEIRNTKTEILGATGTYSDPKDNSALKEIRDFTKTGGSLAQAKKAAQDAANSRDAIRSIESNMNTAVEAAGKIDSFRSEITTYHTETKNARNDILSKGANGEKSVYEKIIDAETSIIGSGGTVADPKEGSALKATKDAQKAAAQSAKEAKEAAASANQGIVVVDSLEDTSTANALSANKGKVLNEKIENLASSSNEIYIMKSGETEADVPKSVEVIIMPEESGTPGADGITPHIGSNGNWFIGETDTGVSARGEKGDKGDKGNDYVLTDSDMNEIAALAAIKIKDGNVIGIIDKDNNIILSGNLADGTYTLKYEMEDSTTIDIGELALERNVYYSVTNTLTNCTNSNSATQVIGGNSYSATITAKSGYELSSVVVTMGGSPVSVSGGVINIASVTGNIVITAAAEESGPAYTNLLPLAVDASGNPYVGTNGEDGYKDGYKISVTNGNESAATGIKVTGFMPINYGDTIYFKNISFEGSGTNTNYALYDNSKTWLGGGNWYNEFGGSVNGEAASVEVSALKVTHGSVSDQIAYIRISTSAMDENSIVAVKPKPTYTNLIPLSTDASGNAFVGTNGEKGYKTGYRINSSGAEVAASGVECTGFMPYTDIYDTIYVKDISLAATETHNNLVFYDSSKARIKNLYISEASAAFVLDGDTWKISPSAQTDITGLAYFRFCAGSITDATIVTVNEEIV